jgi:type I restriction enzyme S subunit
MMRTLRFHELVEVSPSVKLEKSKEYPFVDMAAVEPGRRYVRAERKRAFTGGGTRFLPGDTLFARITPCLENGKIAQYQGVGSQPAFGSTEFFVFRARPTLADPGYVYYLATSDIVRKPAEKSMSGASGRQRADIKSIAELDVPAPPLPVQRKIAAILSAYDDLIENNRRRIKILEEMAQALYREWFVEFRFPGHEAVRMVDSPLGEIPEGWEAARLGDLIDIRKGKNITRKEIVPGPVPVVAAGLEPAYYHDTANTLHPVVTVSASGANAGYVCLYHEDVWASDCSVIDSTTTPHVYFYYLLLKERQTEVTRLQRGSAQPHVYPVDLMGLDALEVPVATLASFHEQTAPLFHLIRNLTLKSSVLRCSRDLLLPRLISGELDVSELDIDVGEEGA